MSDQYDLDQFYMDGMSSFAMEDTPGGQEALRIQGQIDAENQKRAEGKFTNAYEKSSIANYGVPADDYDYFAAYNDGVNFSPAPSGEVILPNKHIRPSSLHIAGRDVATGEQVFNRFQNSEWIDAGMSALRESQVSSTAGVPWDDVDGLNRIAYGMMEQGGSLTDFEHELQNTPWANDPNKAMAAWSAAEIVHRSVLDAESGNQRFIEMGRSDGEDEVGEQGGEQVESAEQGRITEDDLPNDPAWIDAARYIYSHDTGEPSEVVGDQEVSDYLKKKMGVFWWNTPEMALMANYAYQSNDPQYGRSFLTAMRMYDEMDADNLAETGRALYGMVTDPLNYLGFGAGALMTKAASAAARKGIAKFLAGMVAGAVASAIEGSISVGNTSASVQRAEIAGGERGETDRGDVAISTAVGAGLSAGLGAASVLGTAEPVRRYVAKKGKAGWSNLIGRFSDRTY